MSEEKKIIIDEDWKSQVEAEKEALKNEAEQTPQDQPAPGAMPPASLEMLFSMLATEAMVALGQFPNPATQESTLNLDQARYVIDMLDVLKTKTEGNLEPGEDKMLEDLLHQLRMLFVASQNQPQAPPQS